MEAADRLQRARRLFEVGDHQGVRAELAALRTDDPGQRAAARHLRVALGPDWVERLVLFACLLLFVAVAWSYAW